MAEMDSPLRRASLFASIVFFSFLLGGCSSLNMRCDSAGKGWKCTQVDGPPERHTRSPFQPPWSDEYHDLGTNRPAVSELVFERTNVEREAVGHPALPEDTTLSRIACWHNQDMLGHNYLGHNDSDDRMPINRVAREHRRLIGMPGENALEVYRIEDEDASDETLRDWAQHIVDQWMGSPGHRSNILEGKWTHLGVCVTHDSTETRATQVFANVRAYFDEPIPWTVRPGDSLSVSITPVGGVRRPARYQFVPAGEDLGEAFTSGRAEQTFNGTLAVPTETGTYGLRVLVPAEKRTYTVLPGPRVRVLGEGEVAY